jgi:hypothetical protein
MCDTIPLANIVFTFHLFIILSIFYFALFAHPRYSWIASLIVIAIFTNWNIDKDRYCILTKLEARLRCLKIVPGFTQRIVNNITGYNIDYKTINTSQTYIYTILLIISLYRYILYKKIF